MSDRLKGVHTIVPTPFDEQGELDGESLFQLIETDIGPRLINLVGNVRTALSFVKT